MPRLVFFGACEKPIVAADGNLSLINLLLSVKVFATKQAVPEDAVVNSDWHIIAIWRREPSDANERFQQRVTMTDPLGRRRLQALTEFEVPKEFHRNIGKLEGFPMAPEGDYVISIAIRNTKQSDDDWAEIASFPLKVEVQQQAQTPSSSKTH